ncbi:hypothetical protein BT93_L3092 [Corymbia citriodora subsp. variegata]|uniref:Uncharacterized protein n=1 Tax=Corymbia citriodora subsp. variegata TaxID=360336 RepID=A0A8T0CI81_CORYI|nr:hypothetical protein BT93_L3092 [Corymbia citriodora subsp. variegata]
MQNYPLQIDLGGSLSICGRDRTRLSQRGDLKTQTRRHPETVPLSLRCAVPAYRTWRFKRQRRSAPEREGQACTAHPDLIKSDFAVEELARTESWRLSRIGKGESKRFIIPFESF